MFRGQSKTTTLKITTATLDPRVTVIIPTPEFLRPLMFENVCYHVDVVFLNVFETPAYFIVCLTDHLLSLTNY